jgi:hypothetical protein
MSTFDATSAITNTNNITLAGDEFYEFPLHSLPKFITESNLFIMTLDLCPESTTFPFLKSKIPDNLEVRSIKDFQRLIEADAMFSFTSKTQVQILENMYEFWLHDPNSSELPLPIKDFSHFGNQIITLFSESNDIIPVRCFQGNYVELFDYLLKRDGLASVDNYRWPNYSLPYYGAVCNHVEIVRRGLEVGVSVEKDCIDQAIRKHNQEMFDLFISYNVKFSTKTLDLAAEMGLPEMYKHFLNVAIKNTDLFKPFVLKTLGNKDNLEFLLQRSGLELCALCIDGSELLDECIKNAYSVEIFQMVDAYFTKPEEHASGKTLINNVIEFRPGFRYISEKVISKDDYNLFIYFQSNGMLMGENLITFAIERCKTHRLTPGFLKRQFAEQQLIEQKRQDEKV